MLKQALLGLLHHQEMSGYDLEQFINTSITHFWNAKLSQIYRTLKQMESDGLVTSQMQEQDNTRAKRVYRLTDAGRDEFKAWVSEFDTDEQEVKLPFLMRFFFYGHKDAGDIEAQMRVWRDMHQNQLTYYQEVLPNIVMDNLSEMDISPQDVFFYTASIRFGEMYEKMTLEWFDQVMRDWKTFRDDN